MRFLIKFMLIAFFASTQAFAGNMKAKDKNGLLIPKGDDGHSILSYEEVKQKIPPLKW